MAPRQRKKENQHLAGVKNFYPREINGKTYYYFEHPVTHKAKSLGSDLVSALEKAALLNGALEAAGIVKQSSKRKHRKLSDIMPDWKARELEGLKPSSIKNKSNRIEIIAKGIGALSASEANTGNLYELIKPYPPSQQRRLRQLLVSLFDFCLSTGERNDNLNPARNLIVAKPVPVKRRRLTLEHYKAIHEQAPGWLRNAMDLMLSTTLRPTDALKLKWSQYANNQIDLGVKGLGKTGKLLVIECGPMAQQAITSFRQSGLVCPYIIHRKPERRRKRKNCDHFFQIDIDYISGKFSDIRDELGIHADLPANQRPCLYEIRSLGSRLYKQSGFNVEYVQALMGHTDKEMTEVYQDERDQKKPDIVAAGLDFKVL